MQTLSFLKVWMCSVVMVTGLAGTAFADHRHGSSGYHHHHHHHGYSGGHSSFQFGYGGLRYGVPNYGYGVGFGIGGYPYRYSDYPYGYGGYGSGYGLRIDATPRYYYSTPSYTYPSTVIINATPAVPARTYDNGPIVITSPAINETAIDYTLNGQTFTIKPGQSQKFQHDRNWIVGFDRGDGKGAAQYSLKANTYKFKRTDHGWELFEAAKPDPPTDNATPQPPVPAEEIPKPAQP